MAAQRRTSRVRTNAGWLDTAALASYAPGMTFSRLVPLCVALAVAAPACDDGKAKDKPKAAAKEKKDGDAKAKAQPKAVAEAPVDPPTPPPAPPTPAGNMTPPAEGSAIDMNKFPRPSWYDKTKIEHVKVLSDGHSTPRDDGTFAMQMSLQLKEGTTPQQCIDAVKANFGDDVGDIGEPEAGDGGRLTMRARTDRYQATVVCGMSKPKGADAEVPVAYMSVNWSN